MKRRIIYTETVKKTVIELLYEANFQLFPEIVGIFESLKERESDDRARDVMNILIQNASIAREDEIPLCQDCGVVMVFLEIGQDIELHGTHIGGSIQAGVEEAYRTFRLRASVVADPLERKNTGTNTPAFIHADITEGDGLRITVYLKGGGSENMTSLRMFRPTDPVPMIIDYIEETVVAAGPNPCPPLFLGIGIGGTADVALLNSKKALFRGSGVSHPDPLYRNLEEEITDRLNKTGVGPLGFGGRSTVAGVYIKEAPTHIATLPVALNLNCHSMRYRIREI